MCDRGHNQNLKYKWRTPTRGLSALLQFKSSLCQRQAPSICHPWVEWSYCVICQVTFEDLIVTAGVELTGIYSWQQIVYSTKMSMMPLLANSTGNKFPLEFTTTHFPTLKSYTILNAFSTHLSQHWFCSPILVDISTNALSSMCPRTRDPILSGCCFRSLGPYYAVMSTALNTGPWTQCTISKCFKFKWWIH